MSPLERSRIFQIVNTVKTLSFTTLALLAASGPASAYFTAGFGVYKTYRQNASDIPVFKTGQAGFSVIDGLYTITSGCSIAGGQGGSVEFPINTEEGCNIGSNGVTLSFFSDGTSFGPNFYEVIGIQPASTVDVGNYSKVKLIARPSLDYPMNDVAEGGSLSLFYDLDSLTGDVREYRLGYYNSVRLYNSRSQMEKEIREGVYTYSFPTSGNPNRSINLNFPVKTTVEGWIKDPIKGGFRFLDIPSYDENFAEYDARLPNTFRWQGLDASVVMATDRLYVGFRSLANGANADAVGGGYVFPPGIRARLPSPVQSSYTLPPGFFRNDGIVPNRGKAILELTIERGGGSGITIISNRTFELPIVFTDTFAGAMAVAFPEGTNSSLLARDADPDGDGIPNWIEWLSGTNPNKVNAPKTLSPLSFVPPSAAKDGEPTAGYWEMSLDRPASLTRLAGLIVESSTDLKTWTEIPESDPLWKVIDDPTQPQIRVISKSPELAQKRYFRVKFSYSGT